MENIIENLEGEIWKSIPGYEGYYEVSSVGRVRSVDKYINARTGKDGQKGKYLLKGKIMKPKLDRYGYCNIALKIGGKYKYPTIHRLVAITFIEAIEDKNQVNHINGIKTDNRIENLEWCNVKENIIHAVKTGLRDNIARRGEKNNLSKLKQWQVDEIRKDYNKKTCNLQCLAERYGVSVPTISVIKNNITWQKKQ